MASVRTVVAAPQCLKDAALYFDECFPVFPLGVLRESDVARVEDILTRKRRFGPGGALREFMEFTVERYQGCTLDRVMQFVPSEHREVWEYLLASQFLAAAGHLAVRSGADPATAPWSIGAELTESFLADLHLERFPYLNTGDAPTRNDSIVAHEAPMITIASLRLVDTSVLSWEHIGELRRDAEAQRRLRRLRLFAEDAYESKDATFIVEDIAQRIDDYDAEARRQGLSLLEAGYSVVSAAPTFLALAMALVATQSPPSVAIPAAFGAAAIAAGDVAIRVTKAVNERTSVLAEHEVAFIMTARDHSKGS